MYQPHHADGLGPTPLDDGADAAFPCEPRIETLLERPLEWLLRSVDGVCQLACGSCHFDATAGEVVAMAKVTAEATRATDFMRKLTLTIEEAAR